MVASFYFYRPPICKTRAKGRFRQKKRPKPCKNGNFRRKKAKNVAFFSGIFFKIRQLGVYFGNN
jgi:hypothetical protein